MWICSIVVLSHITENICRNVMFQSLWQSCECTGENKQKSVFKLLSCPVVKQLTSLGPVCVAH